MNRLGMVREVARTATEYGQALHQYSEIREWLKRSRSTLATLRRWEKKPERRKVSAYALQLLRTEILDTQRRIRADTRDSKVLALQVARLKRAIETKTAELLAK